MMCVMDGRGSQYVVIWLTDPPQTIITRYYTIQ